MQEPPPIPTLLDRLRTFARDVQHLLSDPVIDWHCAPAPGEWCLTEVTCHLRDVEREVHQPRFRAILQVEDAFLPGAVADEWVEERGYRQQHGPTALMEFLAARKETVQLLEGLSPEIWERRGQHAFFGPTSLQELVNLQVQHDRAHWEQILALLEL